MSETPIDMIKYAIFDMDGTLIDTEPLYEKAWVDIGEKWGLDGMAEKYPLIVGRSIESICSMMKEWFGEDFDASGFFAERMQCFVGFIEKEIPLKDGCIELLEFLKRQGIPMAIATSTPMYITSSNMQKTGIGKYMDAVVTAEAVKNGKPEPDIFLEAARRIGADPLYTVVCEDSINGIRGAHRAAMKPIMVVDRLAPTDETEKLCFATCDSLFDVMELIKKENKII